MTSINRLTPLLRRRAAFKVFSEVLEGDQLMRALWMLEERDQSADQIAFIGFFGATAELLGINSSVITTLYSKINRSLSLVDKELPPDPLPQMLKFRGIEKKPVQIESKVSERKPSTRNKGTPEMTVFVALISKAAAEAGYPETDTYNLFNEVFKEELINAKLDNDNRIQLFSWVDKLSLKVFKNNFVIDDLKIVVHCLYIALCEAFGPVKADDILNKAMNYASGLPAAKLFSPKNFL